MEDLHGMYMHDLYVVPTLATFKTKQDPFYSYITIICIIVILLIVVIVVDYCEGSMDDASSEQAEVLNDYSEQEFSSDHSDQETDLMPTH